MSPSRQIASIVPSIAGLKALGHPDRLRILGRLRLEGPSTATILATRLGLNSGATSYHLRQLGAHGFIEAAEDLGNRRERWWRASHESTSYDNAELQGQDLEAGLAFSQAILANHALMLQRAHDQYRSLPVEWRKASTTSDFIITLTAAEAAALTDRLNEVAMTAKRGAPPSDAPPAPGTRPFTVVLHTFPYPADGDGA